MVRQLGAPERTIYFFPGLFPGLFSVAGLALWVGGAYVLTRYGAPYLNEKMVWDFGGIAWFVGGLIYFGTIGWGAFWAFRQAFTGVPDPSPNGRGRDPRRDSGVGG